MKGVQEAPRVGGLRPLAVLAVAMIAALVLSACGGSDDSGGNDGDQGGNGGGQETLRIVQAPDPVWNWLDEQGILAEMEEEWGIKTEVTETFDWFPIFAGGHADVAQIGTYEMPDIDKQGIPVVAFGRYNRAKDFFVVPPDSNAKTLADLPKGAKIGAFANGATTALWAALLEDELGADFRDDDRWNVVIAATEQLPGLVMKGELDAAIVDPQLTVTLLANGKLKSLYDAKPLAQYFAEKTNGPPAIETNLLIAQSDWFDQNERLARFYLAIWDRGLQEWQEHRREIIEAYPDDFSITQPSDIDALEDYLDNTFNWFDESAVIDEEFIQSQNKVFDMMKEVGTMEPAQEYPRFEALDPGQP